MWDPLDETTRRNVEAWLGATNTNEILPNNQIFFRVMVNACLRDIGSEHYDDEAVKDCFEIVEQMYLGEGLYTDGVGRGPVDYYNSWVMHWGAMLFCAFAGGTHGDVVAEYKRRATTFAGHFKHFFARSGEAVPFGRSLTYRAAQLSMWAASVVADHEVLPWGEMKGIVLRNLRWWFSRPIFSETGVPKIGYGYPNLKMSEQYNSPNSPLYTLCPFMMLAAGAEHPFWAAEEAPLDKQDTYAIKPAGMVFYESDAAGHLTMLSSGQRYSAYHCVHLEEKYEKFAYSAHFGFNVPTGALMLDRAAADNMLLLSEDAVYWRHKRMTLEWRVEDDYLFCRWQPFGDVEVRTWIVPCFPWHVRVHRVSSGRKLFSAEGGFVLPREDALYDCWKEVSQTGPGAAAIGWTTGFTGICDPLGAAVGEVIVSVPHANVLHTNVYTPVLRNELPAGGSTLVAAVVAHPDEQTGRRLWDARPTGDRLGELLPPSVREAIGELPLRN